MSSDSDIKTRADYLGFTEHDRQLLRDLLPTLEKHADSIVAAFYRHLLSFEPTRRMLRDPATKKMLVSKQREYLLSLAGPVVDEEFVRERVRIGEAHERVGLEPRWYLGAYAVYMSLLAPLISQHHRDDRARAERTTLALSKLLVLDAELAMGAYIERRERDLEFVNRELADASRRLAQQYEERGAELRATEERARSAEELASIATLIAGLAHEIGTPMGVIRGHAKLLEPAVSGEDARWRLRTIQEQIGRISKIIQTLLNMARPGKSTRFPVALAPLLENTLGFLTEKLQRHGIHTETRFDDVPSIIGDAERLQQLFLNLLMNAADAMADGGTLYVSLEHGHDEAFVVVRVSDTGVGIPEKDLGKVFDPFFTTKPAGEGSGLGLMVAKGIASDHGGSIVAESDPGTGTQVLISLPLPARDS